MFSSADKPMEGLLNILPADTISNDNKIYKMTHNYFDYNNYRYISDYLENDVFRTAEYTFQLQYLDWFYDREIDNISPRFIKLLLKIYASSLIVADLLIWTVELLS